MESKKKTIMLSVIGVLVNIAVIAGTTYAWFSTAINGSGADFKVTTAVMGPLTYTGTEITAENVLPGWISEDGTEH